jgi:hypothetical protein
MDPDENPFENRPFEVAGAEPEEAPFENVPSASGEPYYDELPLVSEEFDKSKLSLISGLGFVILAVLIYFLVVMRWDLALGVLTVASMIAAALVSLFYLLDDLTFAPVSITERGARFLAGMMVGVLLLLAVITMSLNYPFAAMDDLLNVAAVFAAAIVMNISVTTFLYTMMWEE